MWRRGRPSLQTCGAPQSLRHDDEDYGDEHGYRWDFDEATMFRAHLDTGALLNPTFLLPRTVTAKHDTATSKTAQPASTSSRGTRDYTRVISSRESSLCALANVVPSARCWFHPSLQNKFHVAQSFLFNKDTFEVDIVCIPLYVPEQNYSEWALEGLVARAALATSRS